VEKGPDLILKGDPRPPLPTVAEAATKAQTDQGQHPPQCTSIRRTHDAGSSQHQTGVGRSNGHCRRLPAFTNLSKKAGSRLRIFGELLITAIAIEADCRSRNYNSGWAIQVGQCSDQYLSSLNATVEDSAFLRGRPPAIDALTCQVDDRVDALESSLVDPADNRIPGDATDWWAPPNRDDPVTSLLQSGC